MKVKYIAIIIFLLLQSISFAADDLKCEDFYKYDSIEFELYPEKVVYNAGDEATLHYSLQNLYNVPIIDGGVKAIILYRGKSNADREEGDDIIDQFYVKKGINLNVNDKFEGEFKWKIPSKAMEGFYVVNLYLLGGEKFDLAGLPFMTEVPAIMATFEVKNDKPITLIFDKKATYLNNELYQFRAFFPTYQPPANIKIRTTPSTNFEDSLNLKYDLYEWDDSSENLLLKGYSKQETITAKKSNEVTYEINNLKDGVYVARITASYEDLKTILKVRFVVEGRKPIIVFAGIDKFPFKKGEKITAFSCIENSAAYAGDEVNVIDAKSSLKIVDSNGNVIEDYYGDIEVGPSFSLFAVTFDATEDSSKLIFSTSLYDENDKLLDSVNLNYDTAKFASAIKILDLKMLLNNKESSTFGLQDILTYRIYYYDSYNNPVDGEFAVYMNDPEGKIVSLSEMSLKGGASIGGTFDLNKLQKGTYTIKVVEKSSHLTKTKSINLVEGQVQQAEEKTEGKRIYFYTALIVFALILIAVLILSLGGGG